MRKFLPVVIFLTLAIGSCDNKTPSGPSGVQTITAPPNGAPVVVITGPVQTVFSQGTPVTFTATANDDNGGLTDAIAWTSSVDGPFGTGSTVQAMLGLGTHTVTASVTDRSGLVGSATLIVTVNRRGPPTVTITEMPSVLTGTSVSFRGTAIDVEDGDLSQNITWESTLDGVLGTGALLVRAGGLSVGSHVVTASATDSDGLTGSAAVPVKVDPNPGAANAPPVLMITGPAAGERSVAFGRVVVFVGSAVDPEDGDISTGIAWRSSIEGRLGTGASVSERFLSLGTHVITATVTDAGGLQTTAAITVIVAAAAPTSVSQRYVALVPPASTAAADDMTLSFQLLDRGDTPTVGVSPTYAVSGFWSSASGDSGAVTGTLLGFPDNGTFSGVLSRPTNSSCLAEAEFTGSITPTRIRLDRGAEPVPIPNTSPPCPWDPNPAFNSFDGKPTP